MIFCLYDIVNQLESVFIQPFLRLFNLLCCTNSFFYFYEFHSRNKSRLIDFMINSRKQASDRIGMDSFPSFIIRTAGQKKMVNTSTLYRMIRKLALKAYLWVQFLSCPIPCLMLIILSGNRPY